MNAFWRVVGLPLLLTGCSAQQATDRQKVPVESAQALRVLQKLNGLDVEHHWIAGKHVNWRTGEPDGVPLPRTGYHTHCSAFVAAACESLGIYILRPPEHGQDFLADAQIDWMGSDPGRLQGWLSVDNAREAQRQANAGYLVVAGYRSPDLELPGHIAIVLPTLTSLAQLQRDGPDIMQAGMTNYARTSLREGFKHHPRAWAEQKILFYAHEVHDLQS